MEFAFPGDTPPLVPAADGTLDADGLRLGGFGKEEEGFGEPVAGDVPAGEVVVDVPAGDAPGLGRALLTGSEGRGAEGGTLREGREGRGKDAIVARAQR